MYIVGRMPDSELVIKTINTFGESFSVLCGFRTASKKEILKSYRKLAVKWHPDQYKGDDKKKAEKMFIDIAAAKEVLTDPGKQNSLVCISVLPFVRSNGSSVRTVRPLFIRSAPSFVWSVGRSVVCPYGRSVRSFLRSVCSLFIRSVGRLIVLSSVWSVVWLLFGLFVFTAKSFLTIFVCLFIWFSVLFFVSSYSRRSVFVRLRSSVFSFFRWLVRPFVFFCSFVCCFHA